MEEHGHHGHEERRGRHHRTTPSVPRYMGGSYDTAQQSYSCFYTEKQQTTTTETKNNCTRLLSNHTTADEIEQYCCHVLEEQPWTAEDPPLVYCSNPVKNLTSFLTKSNCSLDDIDKLSVEQNALNMDHKFVEAIVWFFAIAAVVGNIGVFFHCLILNYRKKPTGSSAKVHRFLILNLALADLLMGVYLTSYAFQHLHTGEESHDHHSEDGGNRLESLEWMESRACLAMGVMSFTSSQVSVTLLIVITYFRLQTAVKPFNICGQEQMRRAFILTAFTWIFWLSVSLLPLVGSGRINTQFNNFVRFESSSFCYSDKNYPEVHYDFLHRTVREVLANMDQCQHPTGVHLPDSPSWEDLIESARALHLVARNETVRYYGYYNERSVCTATYFATIDSPSMPFTIIVVIFNLLSFAFIIFAYIWIWRSSSYTNQPPMMAPTASLSIDSQAALHATKRRSISPIHRLPGGPKSAKHLSLSRRFSMSRMSMSRMSVSRMSMSRMSMRRSQQSLKGQRGRENRRMQRRILVMIATDFFCWVPLCIMALAFTIKTATMATHSTEYHRFLERMYPVLDTFTVIVLPINSALNPFIYSTRFWNVMHRAVVQFWKKRRAMHSNTTNPLPVTSMITSYSRTPSL